MKFNRWTLGLACLGTISLSSAIVAQEKRRRLLRSLVVIGEINSDTQALGEALARKISAMGHGDCVVMLVEAEPPTEFAPPVASPDLINTLSRRKLTTPVEIDPQLFDDEHRRRSRAGTHPSLWCNPFRRLNSNRFGANSGITQPHAAYL